MTINVIKPLIYLPALGLLLLLLSGFNQCNHPKGKEPSSMESEPFKLPPPELRGELSLEETLLKRRSVRRYLDEPLELKWVSQLLWAAQGITLESEGYRTAPSAGGTFPIEIYIAAGKVSELQPGLYRYVPSSHSLVKTGDADLRIDLADAALGQGQVRNAPAVIIVAADYARSSSQYGKRSTRYTHMEAGHVGQNISLQAITYGLGTVMVGAFDDDKVKRVLNLPRNEDPLYLIPVGKPY